MKLGMHLSIAGGLPKSLDRAHALACQTLQIFLQNPRSWQWRPVSERDIDNFLEKRHFYNIHPVVAHLAYLPNLAATDKQLYSRSWERLRQELALGKSLGIDYVVCHPGHAAVDEASFARLASGLHRLVSDLPPPPMILLENTSGQKNELGYEINHLQHIITISHVPVGFCLDTAHAFAAGYNLRRIDGRQSLLREFTAASLQAVKIIHLNDSLMPWNSHRDRHWHLGQGKIGLPAMKKFLKSVSPWVEGIILETPKKNQYDDARNLTLARKILNNLP